MEPQINVSHAKGLSPSSRKYQVTGLQQVSNISEDVIV